METNPNLFNTFDSSKGPKKGHPTAYTDVAPEVVTFDVISCLESILGTDVDAIQVLAEQGVITLKGTIPSLDLKQKIESKLLSLQGVDHVHNELRVGDALSEGQGEQARSDGTGNPILRDGTENTETHVPADRPTGSHADDDGIEGENQLY